MCVREWESLSRVRLFATPSSSVHGIIQARVLGWVAMPFSRGSSQPRDWTQVSRISGRFFTIWATREILLKAFTCKYKLGSKSQFRLAWNRSILYALKLSYYIFNSYECFFFPSISIFLRHKIPSLLPSEKIPQKMMFKCQRFKLGISVI